jgi:DNA repair exonuclease SbcCD ATPase subunit
LRADTPQDSDGSNSQAIPADYPTLVAELEQIRSLDQERTNRICQLEQGLDQALACLEDLRLRVQNQELLEAQLALTEDFAAAQHQAIARLKRQLHQQQQAIEAQAAETQQRDQAIKELQAALDLKQQRVVELEVELQVEQNQITNLEQQLREAHQQIQELFCSLSRCQANLIQLQDQLGQAYTPLDDWQNLALTLRRTQSIVTEKNTAIAALQKDLAIAQIKGEEVETKLAQQVRSQSRWQQNCQELEAERDRQHSRITELERETTEMQEQIFQQARQASEYEAAVQYWKDNYFATQRRLAYFKELLDRAIPNQSDDTTFDTNIPVTPALLELLTAIQMATPLENLESASLSAVPSPRFNTLDVPDFLLRRRGYRVR